MAGKPCLQKPKSKTRAATAAPREERRICWRSATAERGSLNMVQNKKKRIAGCWRWTFSVGCAGKRAGAGRLAARRLTDDRAMTMAEHYGQGGSKTEDLNGKGRGRISAQPLVYSGLTWNRRISGAGRPGKNVCGQVLV